MVERPPSPVAPTVTPSEVPAPRRAPAPSTPGLVLVPLRSGASHVLVVIGEADVKTAPQLRATLVSLVAARPSSLVVELAALEFCDLHGVDALRDAERAAAAAGVVLTLRGTSPALTWLLASCPDRCGPSTVDVTGLAQHPRTA